MLTEIDSINAKIKAPGTPKDEKERLEDLRMILERRTTYVF